jgi:integrase/recombinase XerD
MSIVDSRSITIKFFLYKFGTATAVSYPVYARIIYRRKKSDISMHLNARPEDWDKDNQMYFPSSPGNRFKNNQLLSAKDNIMDIVSQLKRDKVEFSVQTIRKMFRGIRSEHSQMLFIDFYDSYILDLRQRPAEYGEAVIGHYLKTKRHLLNYMTAQKIVDISLKDLRRNFIVGFTQHLLSTKIVNKDYAMNKNTCTTYLRKLIAVVNKAVQLELIERNPFAGFKIPKYKVKRITYLNREEIIKIKNHDLANNKTLNKARQIFLFCVYSGLRFCDAMNLKKENIKKDRDGQFFIHLQQQKTREVLEVPMLDEAIQIYNLYQSERDKTGYVLPRICNQNINSYLKVIASIVGIETPISHKVGRHTFATTISLENGLDLETVSKFLGHTSIRSTEIYAHVTPRKLVGAVQLLNSKLREQRH